MSRFSIIFYNIFIWFIIMFIILYLFIYYNIKLYKIIFLLCHFYHSHSFFQF